MRCDCRGHSVSGLRSVKPLALSLVARDRKKLRGAKHDTAARGARGKCRGAPQTRKKSVTATSNRTCTSARLPLRGWMLCASRGTQVLHRSVRSGLYRLRQCGAALSHAFIYLLYREGRTTLFVVLSQRSLLGGTHFSQAQPQLQSPKLIEALACVRPRYSGSSTSLRGRSGASARSKSSSSRPCVGR